MRADKPAMRRHVDLAQGIRMRVLFVGANVDAVTNGSYQERFERTGSNTGNLLIGYGLRKQIAYTAYSYGVERDPASVDREFDLIAIPAANFIFKGLDLGGLADFLEVNSLPIVIVGLGAQMPSTAVSDMEIPAGTQRLLHLLSERCVEIGVRGQFTADVLAHLGIKNVSITGCPSYYSTLTPEISLRTPEFHPFFRIAVNGSRNVYGHSYDPAAALSLESELLRFSQRYRHDYIYQNEFPEIEILCSENPSDQAFADLSTLSKRHDLRIIPEHFAAYIRTHGRAFFDIDQWASFIQTKDLAVGTRFHGNLIALLNGVPAILWAHDSRTIEMANFMRIPYHMVDEHDLSDIRALYEKADFAAFTSAYKTAYANYISFMEKNGVPHKLAS